MTSRYRLTPRAVEDLGEVVEYLRALDPIVAVRFVESAEVTFDHLGHAPLAYPRYFSSLPRLVDLRWRPLTGSFDKYLVFYRVTGDVPIIVRIVHSARDLNRVFDE
ncbi:type II toxin-antitoxin system RelE/ParE family toxin [Nannocystaceae bacterium ST9]